MWCWRRMEKISWTDHVRNEGVLLRVKEQRNILHEIRKRKANWMGHILRRNCLLQHSNPRSQQVSGLQAAHLLRSWVRTPPGAWIFVCCECRVLSGRGLCDELITRPEKSYRLCCVVVCDLETSRICAPYIYIYDISSLRVKYQICKIFSYLLINLQVK